MATEILGLFNAIGRGSILGFWVLANAVLAVLVLRGPRIEIPRIPEFEFTPWTWAAGTIVGVVGVIGWLCGPNTVDVVVYHLPRALMWLQLGSLAHYPTDYLNQLHMPPAAEVIQMHFLALELGDRLATLTHWFTYAAAAIAASLLTARLRGGPAAQSFAALACVAIPQGILTASGAKNEWTFTLWVLVSAIFLIDFLRESCWTRALWLGLVAGLALLTKGTAGLFLPALAFLWLAAPSWRPDRKSFVPALGALAVALLLFAPHASRNFRATGTITALPSSWGSKFEYTTERVDVGTTVNNVIRNAALHMAVPSREMTAQAQAALDSIFRSLGLDANDPGSTWRGTSFSIAEFRYHEAICGNPLLLLLIVAASCVALIHPKTRRDGAILALIAALLTMTLLFSALLRWSPWQARLHLPLFALGAVLLALILEKLSPRVLLPGVASVLILFAAPALFFNQLRPLLGPGFMLDQPREMLRFMDRLQHYEPFRRLANDLNTTSCNQVVVDGSRYLYDYPLYPMIGVLDGRREFRYTGVRNPSKDLTPRGAFTPCAVICFACEQDQRSLDAYLPKFPHVKHYDPAISLFTTEPTPSAP